VAKVPVPTTETDEEARARLVGPFHEVCTASTERTRRFATIKELLLPPAELGVP
jgi:hypothetical protein